MKNDDGISSMSFKAPKFARTTLAEAFHLGEDSDRPFSKKTIRLNYRLLTSQ